MTLALITIQTGLALDLPHEDIIAEIISQGRDNPELMMEMLVRDIIELVKQQQ